MQWKDVVTNPSLRDLPFKIETNEWGQIVMTPAKLMHGKYQLYSEASEIPTSALVPDFPKAVSTK